MRGFDNRGAVHAFDRAYGNHLDESNVKPALGTANGFVSSDAKWVALKTDDAPASRFIGRFASNNGSASRPNDGLTFSDRRVCIWMTEGAYCNCGIARRNSCGSCCEGERAFRGPVG